MSTGPSGENTGASGENTSSGGSNAGDWGGGVGVGIGVTALCVGALIVGHNFLGATGWFEINTQLLKRAFLDVVGSSLTFVPVTYLLIASALAILARASRYGYIAAMLVAITWFGNPFINKLLMFTFSGISYFVPSAGNVLNGNFYNTFMSPSVADCRIAVLAPLGSAGGTGERINLPISTYVTLCTYFPIIMGMVTADGPAPNISGAVGPMAGMFACVSAIAIALRKLLYSCDSIQETVMGAALGVFWAGIHAYFIFPHDGAVPGPAAPLHQMVGPGGLGPPGTQSLSSTACGAVQGGGDSDLSYMIYSNGELIGTVGGHS
jgi:hypothetical protein